MKLELLKYDNFWLRNDWPGDFDGKIFLARAIVRFGEAKRPGWQFEKYKQARLLADIALYGGLDFLARAPKAWQIDALSKDLSEEDLRDEEKAWTRGQLLVQFSEIKSVFASLVAAQDGVRTYTREQKGGQFIDCPREYWFTENYEARFERCQISVGEPYSDYIAGDDFRYIYVDELDLTRCLSEQDGTSVSTGGTKLRRHF